MKQQHTNIPNPLNWTITWTFVGLFLFSMGSTAQMGCTYPEAANYDASASTDDGSCTVLSGCAYAGPLSLTFTKPDNVDWTLPENQDRVMDNVWITRQLTQGLFNAVDQTAWDGLAGGPTNTLWKQQFTTEAGVYESWISAAMNMPSSNCNGDLPWSLQIVDEQIYFDVIWHSFSGGGSFGGFSYTRTLNTSLSGCTLEPIVYGCMDETASNYDPTAVFDPDGSCLFNQVNGCTDAMACNYDPAATEDDGSCVVVGCTEPSAANYLPNATADDGSCVVYTCAYQGPQTVTFTKADFADFTTAAGQDRIISTVWLTRQNSQGLYNAFDQPSWPGNNVGGPSNTEWFLGALSDGGVYTNWVTAAENNPNVNCANDTEWAMRIPSEGLYFEVVWHSWTPSNNGGGFSYTRTLDETLSNCPTVPLVRGCTDVLAVNFELEATLDDGSCVEPTDEDTCEGDIDGDGVVGTGDILGVLGAFGASCQ